jgi:UDP-N-acetylglucosamine--N-acetylmuramyl-(pentapeptide) pyrophosphoryl-undecaprenol N-acetylglucosamine transferase
VSASTTSTSSFPVLFAGGGTGGHVFPLLAVAEAMRAIRPEVDVTFVGTSRGMEATLLPARGEKLVLLESKPIKGQGLLGGLKGISTAAGAVPEGRELVKRLAPKVVLSVGGYAAGPVSLAARTLGVPVALLEPNSVLGLSNWLMTPLVARAYVAFPEVERRYRPSVVRSFGIPLRPGFDAVPYAPSADRLNVLVLGGSQGAEALNHRVPEALARLAADFPALRVFHQAGRDKDADVRARYAAAGLADRAEVAAFVGDVPHKLAEADVVLARSGAGSLAELCAIGRASVLVPFPFAADDHQRKNAESLSNVGASVTVIQDEATPERLAKELRALFEQPNQRLAMADAARRRGVPDAARRIALDLFELAEGRASAGGGSPSRSSRPPSPAPADRSSAAAPSSMGGA